MEEMFRQDNPNVDELIEGLEMAKSYAPSMPFAIEYLFSGNSGTAVSKYLAIQEIPLIHIEGQDLILSAHIHSNFPITTVECVLGFISKYHSNLVGHTYDLKVDLYKPSPRPDAHPGIMTTSKKDVKLAICRTGILFSIWINDLNDLE